MKEREIRDTVVHKRYLDLVKADAEKIFKDRSTFQHFRCPACAEDRSVVQFIKDNFQYVQCPSCLTLYNDPRPQYGDIQKLYRDSESTKFWVDKFFSPFAEARREKIFRPRAEYIASKFPHFRSAVIGDIGAGFGLFLEELRILWKEARLCAIEPSEDMAQICSSKDSTLSRPWLRISKRGTHRLTCSLPLSWLSTCTSLFRFQDQCASKPGGFTSQHSTVLVRYSATVEQSKYFTAAPSEFLQSFLDFSPFETMWLRGDRGRNAG